jgi:hypothetical protein
MEAHIGDAEHRVIGILPGEMALGVGEQVGEIGKMLVGCVLRGEFGDRRLIRSRAWRRLRIASVDSDRA